ncbi:MAG: ABC transporter permease subunit [Candidatus Heimdallarchaeota archaeon]|nr:ABC transporter permease subunit [Candidatus Heimdallarchaeota archaeon]
MRLTLLVSRRFFKFILRDKRLLILMLFVPVLLALVIGYGFGGEINHVDVEIVNLDDTAITDPYTNATISFSETIISWLDQNTSKVDIQVVDASSALDWNDTKQRVLDKEAAGAIFFPSAFTVNLALSFIPGSNQSTYIETFIDNSNPQVGGAIVQALREAFEETLGDHAGIQIMNNFAYGEDLTQLQYMAPSILPFAVFFLSSLLSIITLINERKTGTLDRLLLSPYHKINIILGYILSLSVVALVQSSILLTFVIFVFNVSIVGGIGSYFAVYFMLLLTSWSAMGLGILLSTLAKTELQAVQFVPIVTFPSLLLSGILWPLETLPVWLRPISYLIPLTYSANYLRTVMIEGAGFLVLSWDVLALILFAVFMIILSGFTLKHKE